MVFSFVYRVLLFALSLSALNCMALESTKNFDDPLKVKGQSRKLNMSLILKKKEDEIKFIRIRKNYKSEIDSTQY